MGVPFRGNEGGERGALCFGFALSCCYVLWGYGEGQAPLGAMIIQLSYGTCILVQDLSLSVTLTLDQ